MRESLGKIMVTTLVHEAVLPDFTTWKLLVHILPSNIICIHFEEKESTFGVSTFVGTLKVGNLESTGGTFNGTFVNEVMSIGVIEAVAQLYVKAGMVTDLILLMQQFLKTTLILVLQLYLTLAHNTSMRTEYSQIITNLTVSNSATIAARQLQMQLSLTTVPATWW